MTYFYIHKRLLNSTVKYSIIIQSFGANLKESMFTSLYKSSTKRQSGWLVEHLFLKYYQLYSH